MGMLHVLNGKGSNFPEALMLELALESLKVARRLLVAVIGLKFRALGLLLLFLPGPVLLIIPLGLALLATERARRLRDGTVQRVRELGRIGTPGGFEVREPPEMTSPWRSSTPDGGLDRHGSPRPAPAAVRRRLHRRFRREPALPFQTTHLERGNLG